MRLGNRVILFVLVGAFLLVAWIPRSAAEDFDGDVYTLNTCMTSNEKLGSMGEVWKFVHEGRDLRFCCEGCLELFKNKNNAGRYFLRLDARMKKHQKPHYPLDTCVVSGEKLGENSKDVIVGNRLVRFSDEECQSVFDAEPSKYLVKLDEAVVANQSADYPFNECVISGEELGENSFAFVAGNRLLKFCDEDCIDLFNENPAKYIAMLDRGELEMSEDGVYGGVYR